MDIAGLVIIGFGTGGIKPCVSAFGGDQFNPSHLRMISMFFSVFYFTVNVGSTLSTVITPELRSIFKSILSIKKNLERSVCEKLF